MEAASYTRRLRLEELKRRKSAGVSKHTNGTGEGEEEGAEQLGMINFDDMDLVDVANEKGLEQLFQSWSITKLVRSFRVLDRKVKVDYDKLKDTVEQDVAGIQESVILEDEARRAQELDLQNIAPKRPNWDLKRDMNKRLAKLERRDQEARLLLIRQRVSAASGEKDAVATDVAAGALSNSLPLLDVGDSESENEQDT